MASGPRLGAIRFAAHKVSLSKSIVPCHRNIRCFLFLAALQGIGPASELPRGWWTNWTEPVGYGLPLTPWLGDGDDNPDRVAGERGHRSFGDGGGAGACRADGLRHTPAGLFLEGRMPRAALEIPASIICLQTASPMAILCIVSRSIRRQDRVGPARRFLWQADPKRRPARS